MNKIHGLTFFSILLILFSFSFSADTCPVPCASFDCEAVGYPQACYDTCCGPPPAPTFTLSFGPGTTPPGIQSQNSINAVVNVDGGTALNSITISLSAAGFTPQTRTCSNANTCSGSFTSLPLGKTYSLSATGIKTGSTVIGTSRSITLQGGVVEFNSPTPASGSSIYWPNEMTLSAHMSSGTASKITLFLISGVLPGGQSTYSCTGVGIDEGGSCIYTFANLPPGIYTLRAIAYDGSNNEIDRDERTLVEVKNIITFISPTPIQGEIIYAGETGVSATISTQAYGQPPTKISIKLDDTSTPVLVESFECNAVSSCSKTFSDLLEDDENSLNFRATAVSYDGASVLASATRSFTVKCNPYYNPKCFIYCDSATPCPTSIPGPSLVCNSTIPCTFDNDCSYSTTATCINFKSCSSDVQCDDPANSGNGICTDGRCQDSGLCSSSTIPGHCTYSCSSSSCPEGYNCNEETGYCFSASGSNCIPTAQNNWCQGSGTGGGTCQGPGCNPPGPWVEPANTIQGLISVGNFFVITSSPNDDLLAFAPFIVLISMVSLMFSTLLYMFNKAAGDQKQIVEYKNEIKTVLLNVVLVVMILAVYAAFSSIFTAGLDCGPGGKTLLCPAHIQLEKLIQYPVDSFDITAKVAPYISTFSAVSASGSIAAWAVHVGHGYQTYAGSIARERVAGFLSNAFLHIIALRGLGTLASIFFYFAFKFMIPVGILFRAFPYTRRLGSTMVAIGAVVALGLPLIIYMMGSIADTFMSSSILNVNSSLDLARSSATKIVESLSFLASTLLTAAKINAYLVWVQKGLFALDICSIANIPIVSWICMAAFTVLDWGVKAAALGLTALARYGINDKMVDISADKFGFFEHMSDALLGINISLALFYFIVSMATLATIRAVSSFLGGEFFLYGVEGLI